MVNGAFLNLIKDQNLKQNLSLMNKYLTILFKTKRQKCSLTPQLFNIILGVLAITVWKSKKK